MNRQTSISRLFFQPLLIALAAALIVRGAFLQTFAIPSTSMVPTLDSGDNIVAMRYRTPLLRRSPARGDVIVFHGRNPEDGYFVKRVIAVPGDQVEIHRHEVHVNGWALSEPYVADKSQYEPRTAEIMDEGMFFVMGDNRRNSIDSRSLGPVSREQIVGRAAFVFWSATSGDFRTRANASPMLLEDPVRPEVRWNRILRVIH